MTALTKKDRDAVHERSWGRCEAHCTDDCTRWATQVHHRKLVKQGGTNDLVNLLDVCLRCHDHIHRNVAESVERGWLVKSWDDAA